MKAVRYASGMLAASLIGGGGAIAQELQPVEIVFDARVGGAPFACGETYALGTTPTPVTFQDFRFYVSNVELLDAAGNAVPVRLADSPWQHEDVALLDFEDKTGACGNGTAPTQDRVIGSVPPGDYRAVRFALGVPFELNHADAAIAPSPLNLTAMWWNWQGGYKFLRADMTAAVSESGDSPDPTASGHSPKQHGERGDRRGSYRLHLGSTGCQVPPGEQQPTTCRNPNRAIVELANFDPETSVIVADLGALFATSDLSTNDPDTPPGCMSDPDDGDCLPLLRGLGLPFAGEAAATEQQQFFRVE